MTGGKADGMTRELLNRIPENIKNRLEVYKHDYWRAKVWEEDLNRTTQVRLRVLAYLIGVQDCGVITERERQALFIYVTL